MLQQRISQKLVSLSVSLKEEKRAINLKKINKELGNHNVNDNLPLFSLNGG